MAKFSQYATVLEKRILRGDYTLDHLPTEQEFADEVGVSRMTARKALLHLMAKGIIVREPHSRPRVNPRYERLQGRPHLALLTPAYVSGQYDNWIKSVERVAADCGVLIRVVHYVHWDDPVIPQALASFTGVFVVASSEPIPQRLLKRFSDAGNVVALDSDLTDAGIPSIHAMQSIIVQRMGDHLYELGHRHIDCLNTQPHDRAIEDRLKEWSLWKAAHKVSGLVFDKPVVSYDEPTAKAYSVMKKTLADGRFTATALICLTNAAAEGATRALHEHGLAIGRDVSVCAIDGAKTSRFAIPSRTAFEVVNPDPYVEACMRWMVEDGDDTWQGPLLIQPGRLELFKGESTGPCPAQPAADSQVAPTIRNS